MEAAIADSISTTVATFVDKAVTGAMQLAFDEAVEKAVEERVHAIEDNFAAAVDKAVEDKVKAIEETMQKKIHRAARMAELKANFEAVRKRVGDEEEILADLSEYPSLRSRFTLLIIEDCRAAAKWLRELEEMQKEDKEQL